MTLTGPAPAGRQYVQPTWSPDGSLIAWADVGPDRPVLHVVRSDGSDGRSAAAPVAPFYLAWSPSGDRLVGLGSSDAGIDLFLADVTESSLDLRTVDSGRPYYLDWSPDGDTLLVHVGSDIIADLDPESGARTPLAGVVPGVFQAPAWLENGARVYVRRQAAGGSLVVDRAGETTDLVDFDGLVVFDVSGDRIAYEATGGQPGTSVRFVAAAQVNPAPAGALTVIDLDGTDRTVIAGGVLGFEWSPDGRRLLFLTPAGEAGDGSMRWNVWEEGAPQGFEPFAPTMTFARDYLPFFDQYARSQTSWSPDGSAFAYAGTGADGRVGIWVQQVSGGAPAYAGEGAMVSWRPAE
jgi:WD40 repeat protein